MAPSTRTRRQSTRPARRDLLEYVQAETGPALKVDKDKGVIFGVRVLGRFSRNTYGYRDAVGTEYTRACMESALPLLEGAKVKIDHPPDRTKPGVERSVTSSYGVLRNNRVESDENGDPCVRADLHYLSSHEMAAPVVEDVEKRLGVYGLSINAASPKASERFDPASRRLVIESLALVRSVDLVDRPSTNRNLWESEETPPVTATRRQLLEAIAPKTDARQSWLTWLLEDDAMGAGLDDAVEAAPDDGAAPEDKLWSGIQDAIGTILDQYKAGDLDLAAACKKVAQFLKAHDKLTGSDEPADVEEDEDMAAADDADADKGKKGDKTESVELAQLKAEKHVRQLCESMGHAPTELQVESLTGLQTDAKRRQLIESFKATGPTGSPRKYAPPRSAPPAKGNGGKPGKTRDLAESVDVDAALGALGR